MTPSRLVECLDKGADELRLIEMIDELQAEKSNRRSSVKSLEGAYQVLTTTGRPSWTKYSEKLVLQKKSRNFQIFSNTDNNAFVNLSEYGFGCFATASGTYEKSKQEPNTFLATVDRVSIHLGSKFELPINVKGSGVISLLYSDTELRVIESEEGAQAIQRPIDPPEEYAALLERQGIKL